jgi:diketogulonate reductase-like aldo/keto reductase
VPIPGSRDEAHLKENLGSTNVRQTQEDMQEIATSLSRFSVHGERMSEMHMDQMTKNMLKAWLII